MVVDPNDVVPFFDWLLGWTGGLAQWLLIIFCVAVGVSAFGWLVAAVRHGPIAAFRITWHVLANAAIDLTHISPRRVWALAYLAIQESIRRRVVVVFAIFIVILLFAGWYLDQASIDPARLYLDFVLTATSYLVLLLSLFLSSQSLPADFKSHTIYTVVTKPVRASEVVLGRIVGFTAVASILLVAMGAISYVFVQRGLAHSHTLSSEDLQPVEGAVAVGPATLQGRTGITNQHRHKVFVSPAAEGRKEQGRVQIEQRHTHELTIHEEDGKKTYELGPAEGMLTARVPLYGKIAFLDPKGQPTEKGVNVGDEWTYRSYIPGGTEAAAIWTFDGVTEEQFPNGLPIEMTLGVFRTYKGNIEKGVPGTLWVRNPKADKSKEKPVQARVFESKEFVTDTQTIPRKFLGTDGKMHDLFKEFVNDGKVEVWLQCAAPAQYFGVAKADMYLRAKNASFAWNFIKGYWGIWLQTLLIISLGVFFSTFLSGPVAMIATLGALVGGFFNDFMYRLATQQTYGGGPFESLYRLLTQQNVTSELPPGLTSTVVKTLDQPAQSCLWLLANILPDFGHYSFSEFVASGFNIPGDTLLTFTCRAFGFVLPAFVAAYLCLKNREIAK